ncbi:MAG: large subunit ribosomal protein L15 [Salibacteraceae bacterium]|jgi:large subunit ribosomal protein L15
MDLSNLSPAEGSVRNNTKRLGRGQGSGKGGTSARGHKGAKSRSGYSRKVGFEGGQMPLQRRVPKFGFKNVNRVEYSPINLDVIQEFLEENNTDTITIDDLVVRGLVGTNDLVKVLGRGELKTKVVIEANKFSASAVEAIQKMGGEAKTV